MGRGDERTGDMKNECGGQRQKRKTKQGTRKREGWNGNTGKGGQGESPIPLICSVGNVCDVGESSLLQSKNNIGIEHQWPEKWGESRERGNYSRPISMHDALIKYSHRKLELRNVSGQMPGIPPAIQP